jgi:hypothetical protein
MRANRLNFHCDQASISQSAFIADAGPGKTPLYYVHLARSYNPQPASVSRMYDLNMVKFRDVEISRSRRYSNFFRKAKEGRLFGTVHDEIIVNGHIASNGHFTVGSCAPHTSFSRWSVWGIF